MRMVQTQTLTRSERVRAVSLRLLHVRSIISSLIDHSHVQTIFLPVAGLVDAKTLRPGDLVGVNKDSYLILDTLPAEYTEVHVQEN